LLGSALRSPLRLALRWVTGRTETGWAANVCVYLAIGYSLTWFAAPFLLVWAALFVCRFVGRRLAGARR
jgi:hypothetical protein